MSADVGRLTRHSLRTEAHLGVIESYHTTFQHIFHDYFKACFNDFLGPAWLLRISWRSNESINWHILTFCYILATPQQVPIVRPTDQALRPAQKDEGQQPAAPGQVAITTIHPWEIAFLNEWMNVGYDISEELATRVNLITVGQASWSLSLEESFMGHLQRRLTGSNRSKAPRCSALALEISDYCWMKPECLES